MGFVIGKNGETIKRIQAETGAKVQFNMSKFNHVANRVCYIFSRSGNKCETNLLPKNVGISNQY